MNDVTVLFVTKMTCKSCASRVEGALRRVSGVGSVEVALATGRATIVHDAGISASTLVAVLAAAGYPSHEMTAAERSAR